MDKLRYPLFFLIAFFLLIRIFNLTILPIFNDESIYLDWGTRELHEPGLLFYSLYDAKQPFLMWIFGIFQLLPLDPLFSGRLVSILFGLLTALGLYKIGQDLFDRKTGSISFFFYSIIPIFSFYDRQALMEASVGTIGVWSFYLLHKAVQSNERKYFYFLGLVLGIGFFIKSSSLIFLASTAVILVIHYFKNKPEGYLKSLFYVVAAFLVVTFLLLIQPQFWATLHMNSRFSWSVMEFARFPITFWVQNLFKNVEIVFIYFTPVVFFGMILGIYKMLKEKKKYQSLLLFLTLTFFLETALVKATSQRYLVSFLPLLILPVSYYVNKLCIRFNHYIVYLLFFFIPMLVTLIQITNPILYFNLGSFLSSKSQKAEYVFSQPSGYASLNAVKYLENITNSEKIGIGIGVNTGNPESAMLVYFNKNPNTKVFYLDSMIIKGDLSKLDCFDSDSLIYFVSREDQLVGLDKFLVKDKEFKNPHGDNIVGVYKIKKCNGIKFKINI